MWWSDVAREASADQRETGGELEVTQSSSSLYVMVGMVNGERGRGLGVSMVEEGMLKKELTVKQE